jgi:hypothetical protein
MTKLNDDVSRCYGDPCHKLCWSCARFQQVARDAMRDVNDVRLLSYFSRAPSPSGECGYFIRETGR